MFCFQIFRKWHVLPSLDLSILLENMNCSRKICELYEKKWIVPEKKFSGTIHIFSYNWQIFLEQFIFSDKIDRSRGGTTCYFLQKFIIYYRPVYTSIIQQKYFAPFAWRIKKLQTLMQRNFSLLPTFEAAWSEFQICFKKTFVTCGL